MARTARRGSFRGKVTHNATQQRSRASSYGHLLLPRGISVFEEEPGGRIALDVLPYFVTDARHPDRDEEMEVAVEGSLWYRRPYKFHRSVGADNKSAVVCLSSVGRKCPICEYRAKRLSEGAKWDDEAIRAMRPSDRSLYYVVPRGSRKHDEKPYLWDISQFCFQSALNNELEENEEFGDFPALENGLTLRIRFSEEKIGNNSFAKTSRIDFEQRDYAYTEEQVRELASLDDVLDIKDYKEVERLFFETDSGEEELPSAEEEEDEKETERETDEEPRGRESVAARPRSSGNGAATVLQRRPRPVDPPSRGTDEEGVVSPLKKPRGRGGASATPTESVVAPVRAEAAPARTRAKEKDDRCPHGHRFGVDTDTTDDCEECQVWHECMDEHESASAR